MEKYSVDPYTYFRSGIDIEDFHSSIEADLQDALAKDNKLESITLQMSYNELVYLFARTKQPLEHLS